MPSTIDENDTIYGSPDSDLIFGTGGDDLIFGGAGNDWISFVGEGDDTVYGGAGDDWINYPNFSDPGNDLLYGDTGNDIIAGFEGDDTLYGGAGNDTLAGGFSDAFWGNDSFYGGSGDDVLSGGHGLDNFYGGSGYDTFYFFVNDTGDYTQGQADTIYDFEADVDTIQLSEVNNYSVEHDDELDAHLVTWSDSSGRHDIVVYGDDPTGDIVLA